MSMTDNYTDHTVELAELIRQLKSYPPDTRVSFGGLDFYRVKKRGDKLIQVEFNQSVYRTEKGVLVVEDHSE